MKEQFRILIVDDAPSNIKILYNLLKDSYHIYVATSGADALEIVKKEPPDLILLDIMMPEMDGYEVCRRLKDSEDTAKLPIIFITAKNEIEDEQYGLELGAVDYISKPISPPIALARIKNHLELKQARDCLEELVEARTKALFAANNKLKRRLQELEARDRLTRFQMKSPSMADSLFEIGAVLMEIFNPAQVLLYLKSKAGIIHPKIEFIKKGTRSSGFNKNPKNISAPIAELAQKSFDKKKLISHQNSVAVPILFDDERLGVVYLGELSDKANIQDDFNILYRLSAQAALVLNSAKLTEEIINDTIDIDKLVSLGERL